MDKMSKMYNYRWSQARARFLAANPLCIMHKKLEQVVAATVVDHIVPHRGDSKLFWDKKNWQSLCKKCHDSVKQRIEKTGVAQGCDVNGLPLDENHWWMKHGDEKDAD